MYCRRRPNLLALNVVVRLLPYTACTASHCDQDKPSFYGHFRWARITLYTSCARKQNRNIFPISSVCMLRSQRFLAVFFLSSFDRGRIWLLPKFNRSNAREHGVEEFCNIYQSTSPKFSQIWFIKCYALLKILAIHNQANVCISLGPIWTYVILFMHYVIFHPLLLSLLLLMLVVKTRHLD